MKRIILSVVMVIFVVSMMLAGTACNKDTAPVEEVVEETTEEVVEETTEEAEIPVPEGEVVLDYWFQDWAGGMAWQTGFVAAFEEKYPNIKINLTGIPYGDLSTKMIPSIAQGNEADIMYGYNSWFEGLDRSGLFLPLSPVLYTAEEFSTKLYSAVHKNDIGSDGEVYSITTGTGGTGSGFNVHQDLLDEAGIDIKTITSWDALKDAAAKLTVLNEDGSIARSGLAFGSEGDTAITFLNIVLQQGAYDKIFDPETGIWDFTIPEAKNALELFNSFVEEKIYDPQQGGYFQLYPQKQIAMVNAGPWTLGGWLVDYPELDLNYITLPVWEGGERIHTNQNWGVVMLSKRLEDDIDKKNAGLLFIKEVVDNPAFYDIPYRNNYWNGITSNLAYQEYLAGVVADGNATKEMEISYNLRVVTETTREMESVAPIVGGLTPIITAEIMEVWLGLVSIDEALENMTTKANDLEAEARL